MDNELTQEEWDALTADQKQLAWEDHEDAMEQGQDEQPRGSWTVTS